MMPNINDILDQYYEEERKKKMLKNIQSKQNKEKKKKKKIIKPLIEESIILNKAKQISNETPLYFAESPFQSANCTKTIFKFRNTEVNKEVNKEPITETNIEDNFCNINKGFTTSQTLYTKSIKSRNLKNTMMNISLKKKNLNELFQESGLFKNKLKFNSKVNKRKIILDRYKVFNEDKNKNSEIKYFI
ncbi:MAG: hypothetical protein MJ252_24080, partial [archaeon]|nr:hypothetical protein [archaeon]